MEVINEQSKGAVTVVLSVEEMEDEKEQTVLKGRWLEAVVAPREGP